MPRRKATAPAGGELRSQRKGQFLLSFAQDGTQQAKTTEPSENKRDEKGRESRSVPLLLLLLLRLLLRWRLSIFALSTRRTRQNTAVREEEAGGLAGWRFSFLSRHPAGAENAQSAAPERAGRRKSTHFWEFCILSLCDVFLGIRGQKMVSWISDAKTTAVVGR